MSNIKSVSIVGLGYVGLPLALLADKKGLIVYGLDIDTKKIDSLNVGKSYLGDVTDDEIAESKTTFRGSFENITKSDAVIICVPTPVTDEKIPDLTPVRGAIKAISPYLQDGTLVVVESTINPGVCDEVVIPLLEAETNKKVGKDIFLAHCPERINPGDPNWNVSNINRVVGANSKQELALAVDLYENLIDAEIKPMGSLKEAEAVKIVENSFRDVNIAFVNELAMSFHKLGINLENVIDGAATKPFAFMPHRPGAGVGGHCIPVDPYYLIEYAHHAGFEHNFLRLARDINESMPQFTVELLIEALNEIKLPLKDTRIALLGLSYKSNVGDDRESPAYVIQRLLIEAGVKLAVYDPYIPTHSNVSNLTDALGGVTAVVIATGHDEFKTSLVDALKVSDTKIVIDGRNLLKDSSHVLKKHKIIYKGIGI